MIWIEIMGDPPCEPPRFASERDSKSRKTKELINSLIG